MQKLKSLFRDHRQYKLFFLMLASTAFCLALIGIRIHESNFDYQQIQSTQDVVRLRGTTSFLFLVWNLFLAWIPYWIALALEGRYQWSKSRWLAGAMLIAWLLFFPNAPYILTDLLHLRNRAPIPHWYDLILIVSFAWTGLMLGFLSLYEIQFFIKKRLPNTVSWLLTVGAIFLCSFGIFLGRCLRWNSWDILTSPFSLFQDIFNSLQYQGAINMTITLSGFLLMGYLTLTTLISEKQDWSKNKNN